MAVRARGEKLTSLKIIFYLFMVGSASVQELIGDLVKHRLHPYTIRNDLSRLKKLGLIVYENKKYRLSDSFKNELAELAKTAASRKTEQVEELEAHTPSGLDRP